MGLVCFSGFPTNTITKTHSPHSDSRGCVDGGMGSRGSAETSSLMRDLLRQAGGVAVVDGGLSTELERHGADLNDPLWSAKCLLTSPHLIRTVPSSLSLENVDVIALFCALTSVGMCRIMGFCQVSSANFAVNFFFL